MARRLRIQYEGARYHVINRGNLQRDVFETTGAANAFESVLGEACERHAWLVHAYTVMSNHYHVALETPQANLVDGMHWLQSTFSSRYLRFRDLHGHVFQGRYQSLLVEDAHSLLRVANYIYLNPIEAAIMPAEQVGMFRWSSLRRFMREGRPSWLVADTLLGQLRLPDTPTGWGEYCRYLSALSGDAAEQERQEFSKMESGWAIGSTAWRQAIAREYSHLALDPGIPAAELREIKETRWSDALETLLRESGKSAADCVHAAKNARWKIEIAVRLRRQFAASHRWIGEHLNMGTPGAVRVNVARFS